MLSSDINLDVEDERKADRAYFEFDDDCGMRLQRGHLIDLRRRPRLRRV